MAKNLMIQGTMSNAGKSIITAGILRVLKQDGYKAAPFKSQNMALNSFITEEGLEMGRAQVMQAEAAGIKPLVCMNPILLKPTSDVGSQVIVNGEVLGNMPAKEYFKKKRSLIPNIMEAYHKLEQDYDVIVIEGAGSPAEINLKQDDIVNMGMAKMADAPVLLVGDIDRGGVFAQLVGTVMLLEEEERARIKGLVINKFRGDKTILEPGLKMLYDKCKIPIVGVVPYVHMDIEDEDSLSERFKRLGKPADIYIAVIQLPHIANFTDFNPLEIVEGVSLYYAKNVHELGTPDLVIVPGTKNTMGDLAWLRQNGLEAWIKKLADSGCSVFGICGGYQMLGNTLSDPHGVESGGQMKGMELLPVVTVFQKEKTRTRVNGIAVKLSAAFEGYEIHMGKTSLEEGGEPFSRIMYMGERESYEDGCIKDKITGTYVHGIFESGEFTNEFLKILFDKKGLSFHNRETMSIVEYKNTQYDLLADAIRENMDLDAIYEMMNLTY